MSIVSEIERIKTNIANAYTTCQSKGATLPTILNSANLAQCIASITGKEPPTGNYVKDGLIALFSGEDNYTNGSWADRINGYLFTPVSSSTAPEYDGYNKLYNATAFGGMKTALKTPADSQFTFEVVTRDIKNVTSSNLSSYYAVIVGGEMSGYDIATCSLNLAKFPAQYGGNISFGLTGVGTWGQLPDLYEDNSLDTFTVVPEKGIYHNGVKMNDCGANTISRNIGLFTHYSGSIASNYRGKGKIHAVRMYNRQLTEEEVAQNHAEDVRIYGT